jgi:hypothetical protein
MWEGQNLYRIWCSHSAGYEELCLPRSLWYLARLILRP